MISGVIISLIAVLFGKGLLAVYCPGDMVAVDAGFERLFIVGITYFLFVL